MGRFRFSLAGAFAALTAIAILLAFGMHLLNREWELKRAKWFSSNFKQASLALANADAVLGRLPEATCYSPNQRAAVDPLIAGNSPPLYSWRFAILNFTESAWFPCDLEKPWSDTANAPYLTAPHIYNYREIAPPKSTHTRIFAITGPGTGFGENGVDTPHSLKDLDDDTILLVEVANSGVHWMQPGDFDIRTMPRTIADPKTVDIEGTPGFGFYVAFADGHIWRLRHDTPFAELEKFFTLAGAEANDREQVLMKFRADLSRAAAEH